MLLNHPQVAAIDCRDCQKRLYDLKTGEPKTYTSGPNKEQQYYWGDHAPCRHGEKCPKESPEKAHEYELNADNWRIVMEYRRARETGFANVELDTLKAELFRIIGEAYRRRERSKTADQITEGIAATLATHLRRRP